MSTSPVTSPTTKTKTKFTILPATPQDIPILAKISGDSFENDKHTQLKSKLGAEPYDHEKGCLERLPGYIESKRCVLIKAVDWQGEIVGWCAWGFREFGENEVVALEGGEVQEDTKWFEGNGSVEIESDVEENDQVEGEPKDENATRKETEIEKETNTQKEESTDPLTRLENLTSQNLTTWMERFMPPGIRCLYIMTLCVSPTHQGRGVGSALLKWGTEVADNKKTFIWVHSSEAGVVAYKKAGFEIVGEFNFDLDEFADGIKREGDGKWGVYGFRYMVYGKRGKERRDVEEGR